MFESVLKELLQRFGKNNSYKNMTVDAMKKEVKESLDVELTRPSDKALANSFLRKIDKLTSKDAILTKITETMFNLTGMGS